MTQITNNNVDLVLFDEDEPEFKSISKKYLNIKLAGYFIIAILASTIFSVFHFDLIFSLPSEDNHYPLWIYLIVISLIVFLIIYYVFAVPRMQYAIKEFDIHYKYGVFYRKTISQPLLRVQHVEIKQGLLERKYQIASLLIYSAGTGIHTLQIPGLEYKTASHLRQFILNHNDLKRDE